MKVSLCCYQSVYLYIKFAEQNSCKLLHLICENVKTYVENSRGFLQGIMSKTQSSWLLSPSNVKIFLNISTSYHVSYIIMLLCSPENATWRKRKLLHNSQSKRNNLIVAINHLTSFVIIVRVFLCEVLAYFTSWDLRKLQTKQCY